MRIFEPQMLGQIDVFLTQMLRSSKKIKVKDSSSNQEKEDISSVVNMSPACERLGVDIIGLPSFRLRT